MNKKIFIVIIAVISLVASSNVPVNAATAASSNAPINTATLDFSNENYENVTPELEDINFEINLSEGDYTECSLEEFYDHYLKMTGKEYPKKLETSIGSSLSLITPMNYIENRVVYKKLNVGYNRYIEVGCIVSVGVGARSSWNSIVSGTTYAEAFSSGDFSWKTSALTSTLSSDHTSIKFTGRGTATVTTTTSVNSGLSAAGFTISSSVGSTYYWRKAYTINTTIYK